jgi:hypothetical protein
MTALGRRQLPPAFGKESSCAGAARSSHQTFDKTLDAPVSNVLRGFRACGRKLCRVSAGIQSFGFQCFVTDRVAVEVSVPLLARLALFIVGCDSSCQAIRSCLPLSVGTLTVRCAGPDGVQRP